MGLVIRDELNGPLQGLGSRFWALALEPFPGLGARLKTAPPLARVVYSDRYVSSPAEARMLYELLRYLVKPGGIDPHVTKLTLRTYGCRNERTPYRLHHGFADDGAKRTLLEGLLGRLCPTRVLLEEKGAAMHDRILLLQWGDGKQFLIKLGQGVGHLSVIGNLQHRFGDPVAEQVSAMLRVSADIQRRDRTPVTAELSGLTSGHELAGGLLA